MMIKNIDNILQKTADISSTCKDNQQTSAGKTQPDGFMTLLLSSLSLGNSLKNADGIINKTAKNSTLSKAKLTAQDNSDQTISIQTLENVMGLLNLKSVTELKQYISKNPQEFLDLAQKVQYADITTKDMSLNGQNVNDSTLSDLLKTLSLNQDTDISNTNINFKTLLDKLQINNGNTSSTGNQLNAASKTLQNNITLKTDAEDASSVLTNNNQLSNSVSKIAENSQSFGDLTKDFTQSNFSKEDKDAILSLLNQNGNKLNITENKSDTISQNVEYDRFATIRANEFADTTINMVNSMKDDSTYSAKLFLKPESLGTVFVEIAMKDNKINLKIHADSQDALGSIENQIGSLKEKLENNGIVAEKIELGMQNSNSNTPGDTNGQRYTQEDNNIRKNFLDSFKDLNKEEDLSTNSFRTESKEVHSAQADQQGSSMLERYI